MADTELRTATEALAADMADGNILPITKAAAGSGLFRVTLSTLKAYFLGSLAGGTIGQILGKTGAGDFAYGWIDNAGGGGGSDLPTLVGNGGKALFVKTDETGTEWDTVSGGGDGNDEPVVLSMEMTPTLLNGYVNYGGAYQPIKAVKIGRLVTISGFVKGPPAVIAFTLPEDWLPEGGSQFVGSSSGGATQVDFNGITHGAMTVIGQSANFAGDTTQFLALSFSYFVTEANAYNPSIVIGGSGAVGAHRYWKMDEFEYAADAGDLSILQFHAVTGGPALPAPTGFQSNNDNYGLQGLLNGTSTFWSTYNTRAANLYLTFDFGAATTIAEIVVQNSNSASQEILAFGLSYSDDNKVWHKVCTYTFTVAVWAGSATLTLPVQGDPNSGGSEGGITNPVDPGHLSWRLISSVTPTGNFDVAEMQFLGIDGVVIPVTGGAFLPDSSVSPAFDGDVNTDYLINGMVGIVGYTWATPQRIGGVTIRSANSNYRDRCPTSWKLQYLVDSTWTDALSIAGETTFLQSEKRQYINPDIIHDLIFVPGGGKGGQGLVKKSDIVGDIGWANSAGVLCGVSKAGANINYGSGFNQITLDTVAVDTAGGYSTSTGFYTLPSDGTYFITGKVRWADGSTPNTGFGIGMDKVAGDGPSFLWQTTTNGSGTNRQGSQNMRYYTGLKGDQIRLFVYVDGSLNLVAAEMNIFKVL